MRSRGALKDAHLPRVKTLDEFDFSQAPKVSATQIRELADGGYIDRTEPVVLIGDCGTGKTHLLTGLCVAACRQKRRVRFTTAAALVNELVEAKHAMQLARVLARWARYDLIAIDEVGYVPARRRRRRAAVSDHRRPHRTRGADPDHEFAVLRMDPGDSERAVVQGGPRPDHRSRAHHRHRPRVLSVSPHPREAAEERLIDAQRPWTLTDPWTHRTRPPVLG